MAKGGIVVGGIIGGGRRGTVLCGSPLPVGENEVG